MPSARALEEVRDKVERDRWTHEKVSKFLREKNPGLRGLSERSVLRFCARKGICKTSRIGEEQLDECVARATAMAS